MGTHDKQSLGSRLSRIDGNAQPTVFSRTKGAAQTWHVNACLAYITRYIDLAHRHCIMAWRSDRPPLHMRRKSVLQDLSESPYFS